MYPRKVSYPLGQSHGASVHGIDLYSDFTVTIYKNSPLVFSALITERSGITAVRNYAFATITRQSVSATAKILVSGFVEFRDWLSQVSV